MSPMMELIVAFLKIGTFSFGGGYAMIPLLRYETVVAHPWVTEGRLLDLIGISQSTPGPIAVNLATYVGYQQSGLAGSIAATLAVTLPSFALSLGLGVLHQRYGDLPQLERFFRGVRPAAVGLIAGVCLTLSMNSGFTPVQWVILALAFIVSHKGKAGTGTILLVAVGTGILLHLLGVHWS